MISKRRERFEKVASKRVENIINFIDLLGNCSNKNNYEYSQDDVEKMFREIHRALKVASNSFESQVKKSNKNTFTFTFKD